MSDDRAHVLDMLNAAAAILKFIDAKPQEAFIVDDLLQSAVLYQFTVLGEACRRVSTTFREANTSVDWTGIAGFRNRIVHEYDSVNLDVVWQIVQTDVPRAIAAMTPLVPEEPDGEPQ